MQIEIPEKTARELEQIAPDYLKGGNKNAQRVQWAVERLTELISPRVKWPTAEEVTEVTEDTNAAGA
jgi:hypothetical protein